MSRLGRSWAAVLAVAGFAAVVNADTHPMGPFIDMDDMEISAGGGGKCTYTLKKRQSVGGCDTCPKKGSEFKSEQSCEVKKDCNRRVKMVILCPQGKGKCKLLYKKRRCR